MKLKTHNLEEEEVLDFQLDLKWSFAPKEVGSRPHYLSY